MSDFTVSVCTRIDAVAAVDWNALADAGSPFLRHEFLVALERNGCVGGDTGWHPSHLLLREGERLIGGAPAYLKLHSHGEFVFDWSWAEAYQRAGMEYYPKLVFAVPFTPATGPRLLCADDVDHEAVLDALVSAGIEYARRVKASSAHWLFPNDAQMVELQRRGLLRRSGCQFHWHNPGYGKFDDYLASLTSKRRKQVRKERREAAAAPVDIRLQIASSIAAQEWEAYHALYSSTYERKWGFPTLTPGFFRELARTMPDSLMLASAHRSGRMIAGAHFLCGNDTLYGRNWGCSEFHPSLHFELCYYRAIEFCIDRGISRFEAGAQGEHKLMRGFLPTTTWSAHWIGHDGFRNAIATFLERERDGVDAYVDQMDAHSPFRKADGDVGPTG